MAGWIILNEACEESLRDSTWRVNVWMRVRRSRGLLPSPIRPPLAKSLPLAMLLPPVQCPPLFRGH